MRHKIIIGVLVAMVGLGIFLLNTFGSSEVIEEDVELEEEITKKDVGNVVSNKVKVDIKGAIKSPGVYEVDDGLRVNDVIKLAGGLNKNANTNYINLSSRVKDEMVIWVYTDDEIEKLELDKSSTNYMIEACNCPLMDNTTCLNNNDDVENINNKININNASLEDLMALEGIGEAKAQAILEYRKLNGLFQSIEDLKKVSGIGDTLYDKIKDNITV